MKGFTPCLWFDGKAEEAANFYTSIFKKSKMGAITHYTESASVPSGQPVGSVMTVSFKIAGQEFLALNGGSEFKFNEAISFIVNCENQEEVDEYWEKLTADGGVPVQCGWLRDKFGVSWQIVPVILDKMMQDVDPAKVGRVSEAFMKMVKIDVQVLEDAFYDRNHQKSANDN